ncbi:MAG TPA: glycosyltransferase family 4 protein [Victivallales bacterium]|nr:glycosyltransferase family 4 protein [Victivallales bacterium]
MNFIVKKIKKYIPEKNRFKLKRYLFGFINSKNWLDVGINKFNSSDIKPILYFGQDIIDEHGITFGGNVKLLWLQNYFDVSIKHCNIIYLVSSSFPAGAHRLVIRAKSRGVKFVWNQNGVSYPASEPKLWKTRNKEMSLLFHLADYIIYQSHFCKSGADKYLGKAEAKYEIIYNSVDTKFYKVLEVSRHKKPLTLLLGGNQYRKYRLDVALRTLAEVKKIIKDVRLVVTGKVTWDGVDEDKCLDIANNLIKRLNIEENVEFLGKFTQKEGPAIYNKADILLHTKFMDPCPGIILEAMSCGLPVVYPANGGLPELVGENCGIGVLTEENYENKIIPNYIKLAEGVIKIADNLREYSENARKHAFDKFNMNDFVAKHKEIFTHILKNKTK